MIKRIKFENFRSFVKAEAELQPFTLVIGMNGAGKSNLLKWFAYIGTNKDLAEQAHILHGNMPSFWDIEMADGHLHTSRNLDIFSILDESTWGGAPFKGVPVYCPDPEVISLEELIVVDPWVDSDGAGTVQVLDSLKNGNREDLFDRIEENFRRYIPEVEKLSLLSTGEGKKVVQVREKGLGGKAIPASELSEGTRLILCILTIIHQEIPPPIILLEDIDRGMHPRLFDQIAPLMRQIAEEHNINIIATTHNPYLVDAFQDAKECVLLVEKVDGASILVPLTERLKEMDYDEVESDMPLGQLWYSGLIGAVPQRQSK